MHVTSSLARATPSFISENASAFSSPINKPAAVVTANPVLRGSDRQTVGDLSFFNDPTKQTIVNKSDLDQAKETIKGKLDSLSEMGEMESLRLQMMMDRRSKFIQTLSNVLKKIADTASGIVGNIK